MSVNRQNRVGLQEGRLVLVSPFYPEAGFHPGNAMARNKFIYALSDQALVVDSALGSGGTWEGATENLHHAWVPLYVRMPGDGPGNSALVENGGVAFTAGAQTSETLLEFFARSNAHAVTATSSVHPTQLTLTLTLTDAVQPMLREPLIASEPSASELTLANKSEDAVGVPAVGIIDDRYGAESLDMFAAFIEKLSHFLAEGPRSEEEVASELRIEKGEGAGEGLAQACNSCRASGKVDETRPVRAA